MADNLYFPAYFTDWNAIRDAVTPEQGWTLFTLCLDYAAGDPPQPCGDPVLSAFFKLLSGGIDRSKVAQEEKTQKRRYARYCGMTKESGEEPLRFEEWAEQIDKCRHMTTDVNNVDNHNHNPIVIQSKSESKSKSNSNKADKPPRFSPPSVDEITAYCKERKNTVDPQAFADFYASKGWKVGREPMKDWRAAIRTWERRQTEDGNSRGDHAGVQEQYEERFTGLYDVS